MASRRMLPDTVTLRNFIGEVNDVATYQDSIIKWCYCPMLFSSSVNTQGKVPASNADLYIFDSGSIVMSEDGCRRTYLPSTEWNACENKGSHWTLQEDDYIVFSGSQRCIRSFAYKRQGSRRMWHFEVVAK